MYKQNEETVYKLLDVQTQWKIVSVHREQAQTSGTVEAYNNSNWKESIRNTESNTWLYTGPPQN